MAYNGTIGTGTTGRGVISYQGEYDSFNTTFISGLTYSVAAKGASSGNGTLGDPNLALYDSSGNRLLENDDVSPGTKETNNKRKHAEMTKVTSKEESESSESSKKTKHSEQSKE